MKLGGINISFILITGWLYIVSAFVTLVGSIDSAGGSPSQAKTMALILVVIWFAIGISILSIKDKTKLENLFKLLAVVSVVSFFNSFPKDGSPETLTLIVNVAIIASILLSIREVNTIKGIKQKELVKE